MIDRTITKILHDRRSAIPDRPQYYTSRLSQENSRRPQGRRLTDRNVICYVAAQELALSTVTARRFCDQQEMLLHTATGRSLP